MAPSRRRILATVAASASLAGCIGEDDSETVAGPTASPTSTDTGTDEGPTVRVRSHPEHGDVLVGPDGMTLYMFDSDTRGAGESTCTGDCLDAWPPLTVDGEPSAGDGVSAELGTFERSDGSTQVTAGGWPLYYYAPDEGPGDATGQGVAGVWWVLRPDGTPVRAGTETPTATGTSTGADVRVSDHADHGEVLVGPDGMTLYMFDSDTRGAGESTCTGDCANAWPPLTVDAEPTADDGVTAALSTFERGDGSTQVAADGWPLYFFASDQEPGDVEGQGVSDVWWVLRPDGTPVRSSMATDTATTTGTPTETPTETDDGGVY